MTNNEKMEQLTQEIALMEGQFERMEVKFPSPEWTALYHKSRELKGELAHMTWVPEVGMGATTNGWSDRRAGTVVSVSKSGKKLVWQRDKATLLNGHDSGEKDALHFAPGGFVGHTSGTQRYEYERNPQGVVEEYSLRHNGRWVRVGDSINGQTLSLGTRSEHYDYNF